jgi:hypothetical protein
MREEPEKIESPAQDEAQLDGLLYGLGFEATHERRSDRLDFRDCHVASVRDAVVKAYELGRRARARGGR